MRIALFYHSVISDWNHGNAHFLRGVASELIARGHDVRLFEPRDGWSRSNLIAQHGEEAARAFQAAFPLLSTTLYDVNELDLDDVLADVDLVIVHEWNDHELVRIIGDHRRQTRSYRLLFHDTHHRSVTAPEAMSAYDLSNYDGVLAFGDVIRQIYIDQGWAEEAWTWHEAADVRIFRPIAGALREGDLVWIGNWGDEERTAELQEFLVEPARALALKTRVYGVRYPQSAQQVLAAAGIDYAGWLPNYCVPEVFAGFRATVHIPRRPYLEALPGIPTIRPFEALACGIPLVCANWEDAEGLFHPGEDYLVARDGAEMRAHLRMLLNEPEAGAALAEHGRRTILARHTCAHRVDELMGICAELGIALAA